MSAGLGAAPKLCVVFNNVDDTSSIGRLCAWSVRTALEAGWRVSVVARDLAEELQGEVEWLPLYVPPRLHAVQWYAAATTVRRAMGGRRWDIVHVQQPQLVALANLLQLHYLVRSARLAGGTRTGGLRSRLGGAQARATEIGEGHYLRALPEHLELVPVSAMLAEEFFRLYGPHDRTTVLDSPAPAVVAQSPQSRGQARCALLGDRTGMVIGFLGGADPRKGGHELLEALADMRDTTVLLAGTGVPDHPLTRNAHRVVRLGYLKDLGPFFAACDVFAAVSRFDPGPLTALEAAAHGVPLIGTPSCGTVRDLAGVGAAVLWDGRSPLSAALAEVATRRASLITNALRMVADRSAEHQGRALLGLYARIAVRQAGP